MQWFVEYDPRDGLRAAGLGERAVVREVAFRVGKKTEHWKTTYIQPISCKQKHKWSSFPCWEKDWALKNYLYTTDLL